METRTPVQRLIGSSKVPAGPREKMEPQHPKVDAIVTFKRRISNLEKRGIMGKSRDAMEQLIERGGSMNQQEQAIYARRIRSSFHSVQAIKKAGKLSPKAQLLLAQALGNDKHIAQAFKSRNITDELAEKRLAKNLKSAEAAKLILGMKNQATFESTKEILELKAGIF